MTESTSTLSLGAVIASQFKVEKKLGQGGMGTVFLAEQIDMGRKVVVKVLNPELTTGNQVAVERFRREAQAVARLNHPNIVQIFVFGHTDDHQLYIAMEYVDGRDLGHWIEDGAMPQPRALRILDQVCAALIEAHSAGIVHRDLKPENIMLTNRHGNPDYVKVLDFGIAKLHDSGDQPSLTQAGTVFGTPRYMAPEQARGQVADARADIYALGLIMHEMLAGHHPFKANTAIEYLLQHVNEPVQLLTESHPELAITPRIDALVMRCLEKEPDDRYQSVAELQREVRLALRDFSEASRGYPSSSPEAPAKHRPVPPPRKASDMRPTQTAPGVAAPLARKGMPLWGWVSLGVGLAGGIVAVIIVATAKKDVATPMAPTDPLAIVAPTVTADSDQPPGLQRQLAEAKSILAKHPKFADMAVAAMKGEAGDAEVERIMGSLTAEELTQLQKLNGLDGGDDAAAMGAELGKMMQDLGKARFAVENALEVDNAGGAPLVAPASTLKPGKAIDGFPVPEGANPTISTPQAELFEIQANPRDIMAFYKGQLQGRYPLEEIPNGLSIKSQESPFSFITLSPNGDAFYLSLSRNVMAPETGKASRTNPAGETVFGVDIPGDMSVIMRSEMAIVLRSRRPLAEVCTYFTDRYGRLEKVMVISDFEAATPTCVVANSGGPHPWQAISILPDPQAKGAVMISIAKTY